MTSTRPVIEPSVVAIVDDDPVHTVLIEATLASAGFVCLSYGSVDDFMRRNGPLGADLVLLDWQLPGESGLSLLQQLRGPVGSAVPVIFVTSNSSEAHVVDALQAGADDYVTKPVRRAELVARIRAALRRHAGGGPETYPPFTFHPANRQLEIDGIPTKATPKEFDLMLFLFRRAGRISSRESLLAHVWRTRTSVPTRTLDTYISRLRQNFGLDGRRGWVVEGVYQQGYLLRATTGGMQ